MIKTSEIISEVVFLSLNYIGEFVCDFRNLTTIENSIAVIIAVAVGAVGALVLSANFYYDFWVFMFCFVIAGCQYSVMKVGVL